jgi:hypothetical protein
MGILLALLLGVAAAFFVLAMPIRMLETVTTVTRLSKLMVQAEPPISPNDRTLLSVLAGILTAGIGWVLVDWLVFGRAGMSTLIRTRDDDYEDEDEDHFRPTDPLDLVTPVASATPDWTMPSSGDARRPLSARTDIGDPPPASAPDPFGTGLAGINQALPPINDILPGAGVSAPPLQPNAHPGALPPLVQPGGFPPAPTPGLQIDPGAGLPASWPPLDTPQPPALAPEAPQPQPVETAPALRATLDGPPLAGLPSWMPAPGVRPDGQPGDELPSAFYEDPAEPTVPEAEPVPLPEPITPAMEEPAPVPVPPLLTPQDPFAPPPLSEVPPLAIQAFDPAPPPPLDVAPPPFEVVPPMPVAIEPVAPPPTVEPAPVVVPQPPVQPPVQPAAPPAAPVAAVPAAPAPAVPLPPLAEPVIDRVRLEELLGRLEKGLERRRAAAAAVQAAQVQPAPVQSAPLQASAPQPAPVVQPVPAPAVPVEPVQVQPPAQVVPVPMPAPVAPPESIIPIAPAAPAPLIPQPPSAPVAPEPMRAMPPSGFAAPPPFADASILPLPVAANEAPLSAAAPAPAEASILPVAAPSGLPDGQNDQLLDQPLHVTLDLLRGMVKR